MLVAEPEIFNIYTPYLIFLFLRQKCKTDPLTFSLFHFSSLTFNYYQFGTPLNPSYVLPSIEPKRRRFGSFFLFFFFK